MRLATVGIIVTFTLAILATPHASEAQPPAKIPHVGMLWFGSPVVGPSPYLEAFRQGLRELGYTDGQNIVIESRHAAMRPALLPDLAANLVLSKVEVIVAAGDPAIHAARHATSTIPIVMVAGADPVGSGLVASLARPGGNLTGLSALSPELSGKRLQLLMEALPRVSRVAVLFNPADPAKAIELRETQATGRALGIQLQLLEVRGPEDFESAFAAMTRERTEALITLGDPVTVSHRTRIVDLVAKSRVPAMYDLQEFVEAGGLMAYGPSLPELFRRAAAYVDKILKGARPGTLPVEQPMKFELTFNLRTAKALGLTIPPSVLFLADRVIQ
jgi:putative tryptophan/tyrosine transport system substrate-binding protein